MYLVNVEITNSVNDSVSRRYGIFETEEQKDNFIQNVKDEVHTWNYKTPGAVSFRDAEFMIWDGENIKRASISDLSNLTIGDFAKIFYLINKQ